MCWRYGGTLLEAKTDSLFLCSRAGDVLGLSRKCPVAVLLLSALCPDVVRFSSWASPDIGQMESRIGWSVRGLGS